MPNTPNTVIYQLKVALRGISSLIWRRLLVRADTSIADLHHILQLVMGWTNSHLHRFVIHGREYGTAYDGGLGFDDGSKQIRLADFCFRLRERFLYEYDFDNNWQHDLRIEQILHADGKARTLSVSAASAPPRWRSAAGRQRTWRSGDAGSTIFSVVGSQTAVWTKRAKPLQVTRKMRAVNQATTPTISIVITLINNCGVGQHEEGSHEGASAGGHRVGDR